MDEPRESSVVDAHQSLIRFKHPEFEDDLTHYTVERYSRSGNELHTAHLVGIDAVGMLAGFKTSASYVMKERPTEAYIAQMMEDADLEWGETGRAVSRMGVVPYRLFDVVDQPLHCVGFSATVGETGDDLRRKSDLMVGYFCHDDGRPMSTESAEELIGEVGLLGHT